MANTTATYEYTAPDGSKQTFGVYLSYTPEVLPVTISPHHSGSGWQPTVHNHPNETSISAVRK